jgi:predicted N-acetyltransferase YhbS
MSLQLVPAKPQHIHELGRICYEAFTGIAEQRKFPHDFESLEQAVNVIGMLVERQDFYGVVALLDNKPIGSNFLSLTDPVAGVGPISVDPRIQSKGIGRALMQAVLDYARQSNISQIRLIQDSFNLISFSLYASLGFDMKETVMLMQAQAASGPDNRIRSASPLDLPEMDQLSRRLYKTSRQNEISAALTWGIPVFIREVEERVTGYLIPGILGHGVMETDEDALALITESARHLPQGQARFFFPLKLTSLYRKLLQRGCRAIKMNTLMAIGPYESPGGIWMPSVLY